MQSGAASPNATPWVSITLIASALCAALFFTGSDPWLLPAMVIPLIVWLGHVVTTKCPEECYLPKTTITFSLILLWGWLAATILWSRVPSVSIMQFWWLSVLPLTFWAYLLDNNRDRLWETIAKAVLLAAVILSVVSYYQFYVLHKQENSIFLTRNSHAAFLNLVSLPASAYFLNAFSGKTGHRYSQYALGIALFLIFFSIALTTSRGATLGLSVAMTLLIFVSAKHVPQRAILILLAVIATAFVAAKFSQFSAGIPAKPLITLDQGRIDIWKRSWEMLQNSPWLGIGLGVYWFLWPPYKNPHDMSAGYFVHNDYLQIWIEAGLLGLLLLLATLFSVLWLLGRLLQIKTGAYSTRIEIVGLIGGLMTVGAHSVVDFNFYVPSILIVSGLALGRSLDLSSSVMRLPSFKPRLFRSAGKPPFRVCVIIIALIPVISLASFGAGDALAKHALAKAKEGSLEEANGLFGLALSVSPFDDRILYGYADLYRQSIQLLPDSASANKKALYSKALQYLDDAEKINPLRWDIQVVKGQLYRENPEFTGKQWHELSANAYRQALRLNPALYTTRVRLAELSLLGGDPQAAAKLLEQGLEYDYHDNPALVPYYSMTIALLKATGKIDKSKAIGEKLNDLEERLASSSEKPTTSH